MTEAQSTWHLDGGRALTLAGAAEARRLSVARGRVWLTLSGTTDEPAEDTWLAAGESVALEPGQAAVLEGWPAADFQVLVAPAASAPGGRGLLGRRLLGR